MLINLETICTCSGPGSGCGRAESWQAKGHHDSQVFIKAIQNDLAYDRIVADMDTQPTAAMVRHIYQHLSPWSLGEPGGYLAYCNEPVLGAYPITILIRKQKKAEAAND